MVPNAEANAGSAAKEMDMKHEHRWGGRAVALSALLGALLLAGCESAEKQALLYRAWCKTHECKQLSQAEWQALREEHLLPGQPPDTTGDAVLAGTIAGSIAASSLVGQK